MAKDKIDPQLRELEMIRKLLVLALLKTGVTQGQLGGVLGLTQQQVSAMFPSGSLSTLMGKARKNGKKAESESVDG